MRRLTESGSSQPSGCRSEGSSYPESERAYFQRVYGSDRLNQLHDDHQEQAMLRHVKPWKKAELLRIENQLSHLSCVNAPEMTRPGRSAYSLKQLRENLSQYCTKKCRSLRWNRHYQEALKGVAEEVRSLLGKGGFLDPISTEAVAESEVFQKNLDKHAGYFAFETGRRSKGENLEEALKWCSQHVQEIADAGRYGLPLVISHRSSNSKPVNEDGKWGWKWKCRIILMVDIRALLMDGRFQVPFNRLFLGCPWGEGGMTQQEVRTWVHLTRNHYEKWYSSDYSKFDISLPDWLLEDIFNVVMRPLFGDLSPEDEALFKAMIESHINKEIHGFDGIYYAKGCQTSGSLITYSFNTIANQIMDRTAQLMQGCNVHRFKSLKCGDDNLSYYRGDEPWDRNKHGALIQKYFGIKTTLEAKDCGTSRQNPMFLSKTWTDNGEEREIREVVWNLLYPERYRDYDPSVTGVSVERAEALVLLAACLEQDATMREWFNLDTIYAEAQVKRNDSKSVYQALAAMGTGFRTPWLNWQRTLSLAS